MQHNYWGCIKVADSFVSSNALPVLAIRSVARLHRSVILMNLYEYNESVLIYVYNMFWQLCGSEMQSHLFERKVLIVLTILIEHILKTIFLKTCIKLVLLLYLFFPCRAILEQFGMIEFNHLFEASPVRAGCSVAWPAKCWIAPRWFHNLFRQAVPICDHPSGGKAFP